MIPDNFYLLFLHTSETIPSVGKPVLEHSTQAFYTAEHSTQAKVRAWKPRGQSRTALEVAHEAREGNRSCRPGVRPQGARTAAYQGGRGGRAAIRARRGRGRPPRPCVSRSSTHAFWDVTFARERGESELQARGEAAVGVYRFQPGWTGWACSESGAARARAPPTAMCIAIQHTRFLGRHLRTRGRLQARREAAGGAYRFQRGWTGWE